VKALLLAAGAGTRLRPHTDDRPKPMVEVAGEPAVAHVLRWLRREGVSGVAINLNHHPRVLMDFVGDGAAFGLAVRYSIEEGTAYGTSGALAPLRDYFAGEQAFVVVYGDVLTDLSLAPMLEAHAARGADATLALTRVEDPTRAGIVAFDAQRRITRMVEKPSREDVFSDWANAGVYLCGPAVLDYVPALPPHDFASQLFPAMLGDGRFLLAYPADATIIDFGAPERLAQAEAWVRAASAQGAPC
jgi:NDP-sugar pyrophosphorylase family protein